MSGSPDNSMEAFPFVLFALAVAAVVASLGVGLGTAADSDTLSATNFTHTRLDHSQGGSCVELSYGQVHDYLIAHPCAGLTRSLYEVTHGTSAARVAMAWVTMPDTVQAMELKNLVDQHRTGNITELTRDGVAFTGHHYDSHNDGSIVIIAQAERAPGSTLPDNLLNAAATWAVTRAH
ncbi:hypothetical protein [Saccharothrix xinjiangensis]